MYMTLMFRNEYFDNNNELIFNLTKDSVELDDAFNIFEDAKKYIKDPKSDKCFKGQYSRRILNPENHILPQVYFSDVNKTRTRIINVDIFKTEILDKIKNKHENLSLSDLEYIEPNDLKFSYYDSIEFYAVNEDEFNNIMIRIKSYIDEELKNYIQNVADDAADIKCEKDMSNCKTYLWKPSIIKIRYNDSYYEYTTQVTYYIRGKAFGYVLIVKFYITKDNLETGSIYINELNIIGLETEQNIMLFPGYTKKQLDDKVNIYSKYPYTPYEANMTYYRSSNEDTFVRDLFVHESGSSGLDINEEAVQELLDERDALQEEILGEPSICMAENGDILNHDTKEECEALVDENGESKEAGIFDNACEENSDCPFYLGNTNYENTRGGCGDDGYCELPINVKGLSYREYYDEDTYYPYCYGCPNDKMETCCDIQTKILNGSATNEEIEEHGLTDVNLSSPDYAFEDDFDDRLKYQNDLNDRNIEVN